MHNPDDLDNYTEVEDKIINKKDVRIVEVESNIEII